MRSSLGTPTDRMISRDELDDLRFLYHEYNDSVEVSGRRLRVLDIMKNMLRQKYGVTDGEYINVRSGEIMRECVNNEHPK